MTSTRRTLAADTALLVASLVGAAAVCRMVAGGLGGPAAGPVLVTTIAGWAVPTVLVRLRAPASVASAGGALGVVLSALWTTVPGATTDGAPTLRTLRVVRLDLRHARSELASFGVPLHASPGVVLLGALVTGMAAVAARTVLGRPASERLGRPRLLPVVSLLLPMGLVAWSCVADAGVGSAIVVAVFVAPAAAAVILNEPAPTRSLRGVSGRRSRPVTAVAVTVLAMVAAAVVGLSLGNPGGASAVSPGPALAAAVPPTDLSLASNLIGLERRDPSVVLFSARTPFATYWQVGVLNQYRDGDWVPDPATAAVLDGGPLPAVSPDVLPGGSQRTFSATVTVGQLSSRLLPVPPTAESVSGPVGTEVTSIGAVAPLASTAGERYRVTAIVPPAISAATDPSAGAALSPEQLQQDVSLPPVPAVVSSLARTVTATATTPLTRAEALVNWFRSGRFHYTLTPPVVPHGRSALTVFLTTTRAGTCESFASAFAVMARSLGLPTRVAVGFTGGRHSSSGTTIISGADAHAWPQVYLGPAAGWVSFEPTPELPSGELAPPSVVGPTGIPLPTVLTSPTSTPVRGSVPVSVTTAPRSTTPTVAPTTTPARSRATVVARPRTRTATGVTVATVIAAIAVGILAVGAIFAWWRRRRRQGRAAPRQRVLSAYLRVDRALAGAGLPRPPWRAPPDHARALLSRGRLEQQRWSRAPSSMAAGDELLAALNDTLELALVLERAFYSPMTATAADADRADLSARRIGRTLRRRSVRILAERWGTPAGRRGLPGDGGLRSERPEDAGTPMPTGQPTLPTEASTT